MKKFLEFQNPEVAQSVESVLTHAKVLKFFRNLNCPPTIREIMTAASALEISKTYLEEYIYQIFYNFAAEGKANSQEIREFNIDPVELDMGINVEYEHTTSYEIAKRIALDHLAELPDYYTRLKKMEEEGKLEWKMKRIRDSR